MHRSRHQAAVSAESDAPEAWPRYFLQLPWTQRSGKPHRPRSTHLHSPPPPWSRPGCLLWPFPPLRSPLKPPRLHTHWGSLGVTLHVGRKMVFLFASFYLFNSHSKLHAVITFTYCGPNDKQSIHLSLNYSCCHDIFMFVCSFALQKIHRSTDP